MAWQRKIPFGYMMENGIPTRCEAEATAVQAIYAMYRSGSSYSQIASEMERRGVPYHAHTPQWNKHMVKRILENSRYLGKDGFPRLISDEDHRAVDRQRAGKTGYVPCPASIPPIRKKAVCGLCGAHMHRDTKSRRPRWICQNPDCGHHSYITDEALQKQVETHLRQLAREPQRLDHTPKLKAAAPSADTLRIQNELTHALNRGETDTVYMKAMIFAAAAERYNDLPDPVPHYRLERLRQRLELRPPDENDLRELFGSLVQKVLIEAGSAVLRLTDGTILGKIDGEERTA